MIREKFCIIGANMSDDGWVAAGNDVEWAVLSGGKVDELRQTKGLK
jgi:hypothetical protein